MSPEAHERGTKSWTAFPCSRPKTPRRVMRITAGGLLTYANGASDF